MREQKIEYVEKMIDLGNKLKNESTKSLGILIRLECDWPKYSGTFNLAENSPTSINIGYDGYLELKLKEEEVRKSLNHIKEIVKELCTYVK